MSVFATAKRMVGDRWSMTVRQAADPSSRAILLTGAAGIAGRVVTALSQFAIIPILTDMLGISGYGAFAVLTGLLTWFALADFGLGSSLQNYISRSRVGGQSYADALATTATFLLLASLALFALLTLAGAWIGPALLGGFPGLSRGDMAASFIAFGIMATGAGASFIAMRVSFANHRGYMAHLVYIGTALLGLLGLVIVRAVDPSHKFVWAIAVYNLPGWLLPMGLLIRQLRSSAGPMLVWNRAMLAELWSKGRIFLLFNLLQVLVYNVDYVILSQTMPGDQVAIYAIYAKTFSLVYFVFNSLLQAYWPVTAEILHRGEMDRLKKVVGRCIMLGALIVLGGTTALFLFRPLIQHLLLHNTNAVLPVALLPFFALYWLVRVWTDSFTMVILGADKVVVLCFVIPIQVVLNLILAYYGARWFGIPGLLIGSSLSFVLTVAWALPAYIRIYVRRLAKAG